MNKCFIAVEYHYNSDSGYGHSWYRDITVWDVFENTKYAWFDDSHTSFSASTELPPQDTIVTCEVAGTKCKTLDEFNNLIRGYMGD